MDKYIKFIESFTEFSNRESKTRTKSITEEEFLMVLKENCKNFSFKNDQLWRKSGNDFGEFGLFFEAERSRTIGNYNYKEFFDLRKDYIVPRYKSIIGSTTKKGADSFGSSKSIFLVIPFDNAQIVFAGSPDLALWSKLNQKFTDDLFIMNKYTPNFKVPTEELQSISINNNLSSFYQLKDLGFEFFTNSNSLLLKESKVDWLKNIIK